MKMNRRNFLRNGLIGTGIAAVATQALAGVTTTCVGLTPKQTEGPFYPIDDQMDKDSDLTFVNGSTQRALGDVIYIQGVVTDQNCTPVEGAMVEIWQACKSGKYNHKNDPNPAPLDPNFQYWGQAVTDILGRYKFKTILPGAYPATSNWMRPPHIHFKVHKRGYAELTSQLYFAGDALNDKDLIFQGLSKANQQKVLVQLGTDPALETGSQLGVFDISITKF